MKKILIFKLCCFGDAVFITPAIKSLRKSYPDAQIIYSHAKWIEPLMKYIPSIDGTILFENVYSKNIFKKLLGALKFILKVRKEKFDMVLYGHRANSLAFILKFCGIKHRLGFEGTKHLTLHGKFDESIPEFCRYPEILKTAGIEAEDLAPELLKPSVIDLRKELGLDPHRITIGIFCKGGYNPGTKMNVKRWQLDNFFSLTRLINKEYPWLKVVLMEGTPEFEKIEMQPDLEAEKREISIELVASCDLYISIDTGSMHIAAAMGIPTLSIFGPSDPGLVAPMNYPYSGVKHRTIWKKPPCSPCYTPVTAIDKKNNLHWKDGSFICAIGTHECMKSITVNEVFAQFKEMMKIVSPKFPIVHQNNKYRKIPKAASGNLKSS